MTDWFEVKPYGPGPAGDCGGDVQGGEAYCRRWAMELPTGLWGLGRWAVITDRWYVASNDGWGGYIERQTEYAGCVDYRDPGLTEVCAEARYDQVFPDERATDALALELCGKVSTDDPIFDWDGAPWH
jgi:hypothetical protein